MTDSSEERTFSLDAIHLTCLFISKNILMMLDIDACIEKIAERESLVSPTAGQRRYTESEMRGFFEACLEEEPRTAERMLTDITLMQQQLDLLDRIRNNKPFRRVRTC